MTTNLLKTKRILWSPHQDSNLFVVAAQDFRLYEWETVNNGQPVVKQIGSNSESYLTHWKCISWSLDPEIPDLLGVGLTNGRAVLLRLTNPTNREQLQSTYSSSTSIHQSSSTQQKPYLAEFQPRHSRPCNAIEFCPADYRKFAMGLEKVRNDYCLMIWDAEVQYRSRPLNDGMSMKTTIGTSGGNWDNTTGQQLGAPDSMKSISSDGLNSSGNAGMPMNYTQTYGHGRAGSMSSERVPSTLGSESIVRGFGNAMGMSGVTDGDSLSGNIWDPSRIISDKFMAGARPIQQTDSGIKNTPLHQFGSSETVSSLAWIPNTNSQLIAGMGFKWLRLYDLRESAGPPSVLFATKAVYGIVTDPFRPYRFASHSEDGIIKIWDFRKPTEAVLTIQPEGTRSSGIARLAFSPKRSGLLAAVTRDASIIKLYEIQDRSTNSPHASFSVTPTNQLLPGSITNSPVHMASHVSSTVGAKGGDAGLSTAVAGVKSGLAQLDKGFSGVPSYDGQTGSGGGLADSELPILHRVRQTRPISTSIASFSWVHNSNSGVHRLISVNKNMNDSKIEVHEFFDPLRTSFNPRNGLIVSGWKNAVVYTTKDEFEELKTQSLEKQNKLPSTRRSSEFDSALKTVPSQMLGLWKEKLKIRDENQGSLSRTTSVDRGLGSLPTGFDRAPRKSRDGAMSLKQSMLTLNLETEWASRDIAVLMRKRAVMGYGMNATMNHYIIQDDRKLIELWTWMSQMEQLALTGKAQIGGLDFSYQGVQKVLQGLGAQPTSRRYSPPYTSPASLVSSHASTPLEPSLPNTTVDHQLFSTVFRSPQRKLALIMCGWGFTKDELELEVQRLEIDCNYVKAAAWAFFHSDLDRAIKALNNSRDERLKLVSVALAGYSSSASNSPDSSSIRATWQELCRNLSNEIQEPYIRAMFGYIADRNWMTVLSVNELSLRERMGIALRFLDDGELNIYIQRITDTMIAKGDIEGILFTGLTPEGVELFSNYVDKSGDTQTASLVLSYCVPKRFKDQRVEQWVECYRSLLDQWQLYSVRAHFDIARGKHLGSEMSAIPPQVHVRCNFCNQSISHSVFIPGVKDKDGRRVTVTTTGNPASMAHRQKATACPNCRKPLPRCALCLLTLGTPLDHSTNPLSYRRTSSTPLATQTSNSPSTPHPISQAIQLSPLPPGFEAWFTWCQTCRHGGHSIHMLEWFRKFRRCPVADCECTCDLL